MSEWEWYTMTVTPSNEPLSSGDIVVALLLLIAVVISVTLLAAFAPPSKKKPKAKRQPQATEWGRPGAPPSAAAQGGPLSPIFFPAMFGGQ